jgi:hypothetical protein
MNPDGLARGYGHLNTLRRYLTNQRDQAQFATDSFQGFLDTLDFYLNDETNAEHTAAMMLVRECERMERTLLSEPASHPLRDEHIPTMEEIAREERFGRFVLVGDTWVRQNAEE